MNNKTSADDFAPGNSPTDARDDARNFAVVGIGASAGGIPALKKFFASTPSDSGMAFVVILHLSPDHESRLAEVLASSTAMPVTRVHEQTLLEPDAVYVVSPNQSLSMVDDTLMVSAVQTFEERRAPIDIFFRTLAESKGARAAGVILSGTGSDGTSGLRRIREHHGLVIAQDPDEAEYGNMPSNAIGTGLVDEVLRAADIAAKLIAYARRLPQVEAAEQLDSNASALRAIFTNLHTRTGHDFSDYKRSTIMRRITRRMTLHELVQLSEYANFLRTDAGEAAVLVRDFLISVTNFFRDKEAFTAIEQHVIPRLFEGKGVGDQVRIWVAGCATGEEAYSLAVLASEYAATVADPPAVKVFATDIDVRAIAVAREGFYADALVADIAGERLKRFFTREPGGYRVGGELRDRVLFAAHDLLKDPPFSRIDLCCCRNVLIYLNRPAQERVIATLHFSLAPGGYLFLGLSETIENSVGGFVALDKDQRIFQSCAITLPPRSALPPIDAPLPAKPIDRGIGQDIGLRIGRVARLDFASAVTSVSANEGSHASATQRRTFADLHLRLLEQYAPPSVVVNEDYDIVHLSEHAGQYLQLAGGEPSHNLLKVALPELRLELRSSLHQATHARHSVQTRALPVTVGGQPRLVNLIVRPVVSQSDVARGFLLVLFEVSQEGANAAATFDAASSEALTLASADSIAGQLDDELLQVKSQLRSNVEQYEIQTEELKASNEELQAMNEELQSVNEELTSVNEELKVKIDELSQANNDFQNLINSTDIGTIFLDRSLHVKIFTPRIRDIFNLIPADRGRSLLDITSKLLHDDLIADIEHVLETAQPVARELRATSGSWQLMRVLPYRTLENRIEGVVMTFTDLSEREKNEEALLESKQSLDAALAIAEIGIWRWNPAAGRVTLETSALRLFGVDGSNLDSASVLAMVHPEDRAVLAAAIETSAREGKPYSAEFRVIRPDTGETRSILSKGGPVAAPAIDGGEASAAGVIVMGASVDITERKEALAARLHFRALFESAPGLYLVLEPSNFEIVAASDAYLTATMTERPGLIGKNIFEAFPDDRLDTNADGIRNLRASLERVKAGRCADVMAIQRYPVARAWINGQVEWEERWWSPINSPVLGPSGEVAYIIHRVEDVTAFVVEKRAAGQEAEGTALLESRSEQMEAEIVLRAKDLERANEQLRDSENRYRVATQELESLNQQLEQRVAERTFVAEERLGQLRALAMQLTQAEARERRRIAQVLHDHLQQLLLSAKFRLRTLKSQAPQADFGPVLESLDESLKASRSLVAELRPPILHHAKLSEALRWLAERTRQQQGLAVEVVVFGREPTLDEDMKLLLFQSVRELLLNITKHAAVDRAQIRVSASRSRWLFVRVSDSGSGFRFADSRERSAGNADTGVARADTGMSAGGSGSGTGLGLLGIRERIEVLGGSMVVRSTIGRGTRVVLRVPVERRIGKSAVDPLEVLPLRRVTDPREPERPRPVARTRILLVDDHTMVRQGLRGLIEEESDMQVVGEAQDGLQAIALTGELAPEVVLMDINMPRMDGIEATRRIKAAHPHIHVIGLSMHADAGVMNSMRAAGVSDYVTKDTVADALCDAIREQVKNKSVSG